MTWIFDAACRACLEGKTIAGKTNETIDSFVHGTMKIKGLTGTFMKYTFKHTLRPRALTGAQFKGLIAQTPFTKVQITTNPVNLELLLGK